jgi:hypothetical protein
MEGPAAISSGQLDDLCFPKLTHNRCNLQYSRSCILRDRLWNDVIRGLRGAVGRAGSRPPPSMTPPASVRGLAAGLGEIVRPHCRPWPTGTFLRPPPGTRASDAPGSARCTAAASAGGSGPSGLHLPSRVSTSGPGRHRPRGDGHALGGGSHLVRGPLGNSSGGRLRPAAGTGGSRLGPDRLRPESVTTPGAHAREAVRLPLRGPGVRSGAGRLEARPRGPAVLRGRDDPASPRARPAGRASGAPAPRTRRRLDGSELARHSAGLDLRLPSPAHGGVGRRPGRSHPVDGGPGHDGSDRRAHGPLSRSPPAPPPHRSAWGRAAVGGLSLPLLPGRNRSEPHQRAGPRRSHPVDGPARPGRSRPLGRRDGRVHRCLRVHATVDRDRDLGGAGRYPVAVGGPPTRPPVARIAGRGDPPGGHPVRRGPARLEPGSVRGSLHIGVLRRLWPRPWPRVPPGPLEQYLRAPAGGGLHLHRPHAPGLAPSRIAPTRPVLGGLGRHDGTRRR